jgi:hypothetical protein
MGGGYFLYDTCDPDQATDLLSLDPVTNLPRDHFDAGAAAGKGAPVLTTADLEARVRAQPTRQMEVRGACALRVQCVCAACALRVQCVCAACAVRVRCVCGGAEEVV